MYIDFEKTKLLLEADEPITDKDVSSNAIDVASLAIDIPKISGTKDAPAISNKFLHNGRPVGILLEDTYNNPFFPIRPMPRLDTAKAEITLVYKRYRELYANYAVEMLPWHFVIEMIGDRYLVFNTRPIDMQFPIDNLEAQDRRPIWKPETIKFMDDNQFNIQDMIHICILGDTFSDIYTRKIYPLIGRFCMVPFYWYFRLPEGLYQRFFPLNISEKINLQYLTKFVRR